MKTIFSLRVAILCSAFLFVSASVGKEPDIAVDPGPQPDFAQAQQNTESAIKASFFDPDAAQFKWPYAWTGGFWKPLLNGKKVGWFTCGLVNGKNRVGGYVGFRSFVSVVYNDHVIYTEIGQGGDYDFTDLGCRKATSSGVLRESQAITQIPINPNKPQIGMSFSIVPDGLYVVRVLDGSVAQEVGIDPGMVISQVNGISTKGMTQSIARQILAAAEGELVFTIIGKGEVKFTKRPVRSAAEK